MCDCNQNIELGSCNCKTPVINILGERGKQGERGPAGKDGFLFNPDATDVTFRQDPIGNLLTVNDALLYLLYQAPAINSFTISAAGYDLNQLEKGTIIPPGVITLHYNISSKSKEIVSKTITPNIGELPDLIGSVADSQGANTDRSYTLTISDGDSRGIRTARAGFGFKDRVFAGVSMSPLLTEAEIYAMPSELYSTRPGSHTFDASRTGGAYLYIIVPATSNFVINKFEYGATTITFLQTYITLNLNGLPVNCLVYRSPEKVNGSSIQIRFS